jgi:ribosomal-protein-alanine N-acetyltransferase
VWTLIKLEFIAPHHCAALLAFELQNAQFFSRFVPARPKEMLTPNGMASAIDALVDEMQLGEGLYLLAIEGDKVLGRINFTVNLDVAEVGYRVAEQAAGRGIAQYMLFEGLEYLRTRYDLKKVVGRAMTSNPASAHILRKAGFVIRDIEENGGTKRGFSGDMVRYERAL